MCAAFNAEDLFVLWNQLVAETAKCTSRGPDGQNRENAQWLEAAVPAANPEASEQEDPGRKRSDCANQDRFPSVGDARDHQSGSGLPSWAFAWCHKTEWAGVHHRELGELQVLLRRVDSPRAIVQKFQDLIVILSQL
jgi:hypothetical protein